MAKWQTLQSEKLARSIPCVGSNPSPGTEPLGEWRNGSRIGLKNRRPLGRKGSNPFSPTEQVTN